jgi:mono/diheme cytochrome c family protein
MRPVLKAVLWFVGLAVIVASVGLVALMSTGFSARAEPGRIESFFAPRIRNLAIGRQARDLRNPVTRSPEVIANGREHFADHCATCHANDGSGDTPIGRNLYPRVPDLRLAPTQKLSDGEIFYIIENGIRLTGMPAWGTGHESGEESSWMLVHFIRHLPEVSEAELAAMARLNPVPPDEVRQRMIEEDFLQGTSEPTVKTSPPPHKH